MSRHPDADAHGLEGCEPLGGSRVLRNDDGIQLAVIRGHWRGLVFKEFQTRGLNADFSLFAVQNVQPDCLPAALEINCERRVSPFSVNAALADD